MKPRNGAGWSKHPAQRRSRDWKYPPDNAASDRYINPAPGTVRAFGVYLPPPYPPPLAGEGREGVPARGLGMTGTARSSAGLDDRRRRLLYRSWHRGTREMDLIMGRFADAAVGELTEAEIAELERLADVPDPELYAWLTGGRPVPDDYNLAVFRRLRDFHALRPIE